jgi:hypothetical protein
MELEYEFIAFMRNPIEEVELKIKTEQLIDLLSKTDAAFVKQIKPRFLESLDFYNDKSLLLSTYYLDTASKSSNNPPRPHRHLLFKPKPPISRTRSANDELAEILQLTDTSISTKIEEFLKKLEKALEENPQDEVYSAEFLNHFLNEINKQGKERFTKPSKGIVIIFIKDFIETKRTANPTKKQ